MLATLRRQLSEKVLGLSEYVKNIELCVLDNELDVVTELISSVTQDFIQIKDEIRVRRERDEAIESLTLKEKTRVEKSFTEWSQLTAGQLLGKRRGQVYYHLDCRSREATKIIPVVGLLETLNSVVTSEAGLKEAAALVKNYGRRLALEGRSTGVVLTTDLTNQDAFPILSKYVGVGLEVKSRTAGSDLADTITGVDAYKILRDTRWSKLSKKAETFYTQRLMALIHLQLIYVTKIIVRHTSDLGLLTEMAAYERYLTGKLDTGIRRQLKLGNLRVRNVLYGGLDCEYQNHDIGTNEILSTQLASTSRFVLDVPIWDGFRLEKFQTASGERYRSHLLPGEEGIASIFTAMIRGIRNFAYPGKDVAKAQLVNKLIESGFNYTRPSYGFNFVMNRGQIVQWFKLGSVTVDEMFVTIVNSVEAGASKRINDFWLTLSSTDWGQVASEVKGVNEPKLEGFKRAQDDLNLGDVLEGEVVAEKAERLASKISIGGVSLQITYKRELVMIGHYNAADLSLVEGIKELLWNKEKREGNVDVLRKCFVTLGPGFRYGGYEVKLRDTLLLSSAAASSLAKIGEGYGPELSKIEITQEDRNNMKGVLETRPAFFREYAMRDALVTLIHCMTQEEMLYQFNYVGVPTTQMFMSKISQK